jgi:23S rRNA (adenine2503-C2)-methyltransferase
LRLGVRRLTRAGALAGALAHRAPNIDLRTVSSKRSIYGYSLPELEDWCRDRAEKPYRAKQLFQWVFSKRVDEFDQMSDLVAEFRKQLAESFCISCLKVVRRTGSKDTTQKFLFALRDGAFVESVLIPASPALYGAPSDRKTICVSTQVGCAYGCKFCASGLDGWTRNLDAGEIVEQIVAAERESGEKINNIVFMGMGEPLANYTNLIKAVEIINAPWGIGIGARHITISTSGLAPKIKELAEQPLQVRLAISLHGATDNVRQTIMPVNRKYNIATLMEACAYYRQRKHQKITFEYILIKEVNDSLDQAVELSGLATRLEAKINLIPYNTVQGLSWSRPSETRQRAFLRLLRNRGVDATIRREKGHDINAACGQLRLQTMRDKTFAANSNLR